MSIIKKGRADIKILIINHFPLRGSGSGIYIKNIAKRLIELGHEVCIIIPENTTDIEKIKGAKIHPVYFKREEIIQGQLDFNFPCMDPHPRSDFLFHNMTSEQIKQYENAFRIVIEEELENFKPDVIHSQHIWILSGILKEYNIPYIITSHGAEFITFRKTRVFDEYGVNAIEGCRKLVAISDDNVKEIIQKFPTVEEKIIFIKNGFNPADFFIENLDKKKILEYFSIHKNFDKIVLFAGRVSELKGIDVLLKAAKIYEKEDILTLIVGDGEYKEKLMDLKEKLQLENVIFLGDKSQNDLRKLYNISDVFVLPSRKEALPLVAIEALACGTPTIITNLFGIEKIITEEVGLIFDMDDEKMLASKIESILSGQNIYDKEVLARYAKENFSEEKLVDKLISIYRDVCNEV